jgi:hypothetical protein
MGHAPASRWDHTAKAAALRAQHARRVRRAVQLVSSTYQGVLPLTLSSKGGTY